MNRKGYRHLTFNDRLIIERLLSKGYSKKAIADAVGCCLATVYNELKRASYMHTNSNLTQELRYSPDIAQKRYDALLKAKGRVSKILLDAKLASEIATLISAYRYSPYAALSEIRRRDKAFSVEIRSVTTIYSAIRKGFIPGVTLKTLPRRGKSSRSKAKVTVQKRASFGVSIEKRPDERMRSCFGAWEMDSVVGSPKCLKTLLVLTERKTRFEIVMPLKSHKSQEVVKALDILEKRLGKDFYNIFRNITVDNGAEFSDFEGMQRSILRKCRSPDAKHKRTQIYFCHPRSPFERGSNENNNLLLRRFFPKGSDFDKGVNKRKVRNAQDWMNFYPRKLFDGRSSFELFYEELGRIGAEDVINWL